MPSHYSNQWWLLINHPPSERLQWKNIVPFYPSERVGDKNIKTNQFSFEKLHIKLFSVILLPFCPRGEKFDVFFAPHPLLPFDLVWAGPYFMNDFFHHNSNLMEYIYRISIRKVSWTQMSQNFISYILFCNCPIVLKFCTEHSSDTAQNDWTTEMNVMDERVFIRFEFNP